MYLMGILVYDLFAVGVCFLFALLGRKRNAAFSQKGRNEKEQEESRE